MSTGIKSWKDAGRGNGRRPLVLAATVTPFEEAGAVDLDGYEENLRFQDAMGVDGILVAGTTGEREAISAEERDDLVSAAKLVLDSECLIVAGLERGAVTAELAALDVQRMADAGAAIALVPPPFEADSPSRDDGAVVEYLEHVLREASIPVLFYHGPSFKEMPLARPVLERVRDLPGLAGVKDSIGERSLVEMWTQRSAEDFGVFVGSASLFTEMATDVTGGILAIASIHPSEYVTYATHVHDDPMAMVALSVAERSLKKLRMGGVAALKQLHDELGFFGGPTRA